MVFAVVASAASAAPASVAATAAAAIHAIVRRHQITRITLTLANVLWWSATSVLPGTLQCRYSFRFCSTANAINLVDVQNAPLTVSVVIIAVLGGKKVVVAVVSLCRRHAAEQKGGNSERE